MVPQESRGKFAKFREWLVAYIRRSVGGEAVGRAGVSGGERGLSKVVVLARA